jgi:HK97 family phage major capsid protein/HK97 family phage prohead protease
MEKETRNYTARARAEAKSIHVFIPYNSESQPIGGLFTEILRAGCFSIALRKNGDIKSLWQHITSQPLARTKNGTMDIYDEPDGLRAVIRPNLATSWGKDAIEAVKSGLVDQVSFGFEVANGGDRWIKGDGRALPLREITLVKNLFELSLVTFPAYQATKAEARAKAKEAGETESPFFSGKGVPFSSEEEIFPLEDVINMEDEPETPLEWQSSTQFYRSIYEAGLQETSLPSPIIRPSDRPKDPGRRPKVEALDRFERKGVLHVDRRLLRYSTGLEAGTPSAGGFLIGEDYSDRILKNKDALLHHPLPGMVSRVTLKKGKNRMVLPSWESKVDFQVLGEGLEKSATKPQLTAITPELHKLVALVFASDELVEDTDLGTWLESHAAIALLYELENIILNGTGAGMGQGILNAASTQQVVRAGPGAIANADVEGMWSLLYSGCKLNAVWIANSYGAEQELTALNAYSPSKHTLFGRPIIGSDWCPALGSRGDIILMDPSQYYIIDRQLRSASSIYVRYESDETAFRFVYRYDSASAWTTGINPPKNPATTVGPAVCLSV